MGHHLFITFVIPGIKMLFTVTHGTGFLARPRQTSRTCLADRIDDSVLNGRLQIRMHGEADHLLREIV